MKVKSESEVAQSCPTPSVPMDCSPPGSSVHGIFPGKSTGVGCHCLLRLRVGHLAKLTWQDPCWRQGKWSDIKGRGSFLKGLSHSWTSSWKSAAKDEAWGEESSEELDLGLDKERPGVLSQALTDLSWMQTSVCKWGSISKAESLNII